MADKGMQQQPVIIAADPPDKTFEPLCDRIRRHGEKNPHAIAVVAGEEQLSWEELRDAMNGVAAELSNRKIGKGFVVATHADTSIDHLIAYLGILASGACVALLPLGMPGPTLRSMLENCDAALVLASDPSTEGLDAGRVEPVDMFVTAAARKSLSELFVIDPFDPMDIIFSSGTTSTPKGIEHDHAFRARQAARFGGYGYDNTSVSIVCTPLYSNTTLSGLLPTLAAGGAVVLQARFREAEWLSLVARHRVTHTMMVPVQYQRLLAHSDFDKTDLSSLRTKLSTSSPMPVSVIRDALARFPGRLVNIYGMTEGGVGTMLDCAAHPDKLHTCGRPVLGTRLRFINSNDKEVPPGETGEIVGRSPTMMSGYRKAPERTREALWTSPEGDTYIRSGDMGRLDEDGFLLLLDRRKDMILSGGSSVFAADLEAVLLSHPDVADAAVIAVPSERWGETPVGFFVLKGSLSRENLGDDESDTGLTPDGETLLTWVNARLGKTQRLSALHPRESLPRSDIGKILKRQLRHEYSGR